MHAGTGAGDTVPPPYLNLLLLFILAAIGSFALEALSR
jgi:hypothetical protein